MDDSTTTIDLTINGRKHTVTTHPQRPLLDVLREDLHLTGTRFGCGQGDCGACSVLLDDQRIFACSTPVSDVADKSITTIEGLAHGETLHPVQQAFVDEGAFQCAYCTSGMIVAAVALLREKPKPSDEEIRDGMNGNICRCCSHAKIMNAIHRAVGAGVKA